MALPVSPVVWTARARRLDSLPVTSPGVCVMAEESSVARGRPPFMNHPLRAIRALDYTVIFARDLDAMRRFYTEVMQFEVYFELGGGSWVELRVGSNILALDQAGRCDSRSGAAGGNGLPAACVPRAARRSRCMRDRVARRRTSRSWRRRPISRGDIARCSSATRTATCSRSTPTSEALDAWKRRARRVPARRA